MRVNFLLNWRLNPYHVPIIVAKQLGYYDNCDINLSILQPTDPSEVTKIIGDNQISLGLKAMVHCLAARSQGYRIKSIATLLDEPPTGIISLKSKNINQLQDIIGKRIGYVGKFGKVMLDDLAVEAGLQPDQYTAVRVGMDGSEAILQDVVDATIGIACFQQLTLTEQGFATNMLRIDEAANLGCCCFCSIMFIAHEDFLAKEPTLAANFLQASLMGAKITREQPDLAFDCLREFSIVQNTELNRKIFYHVLPFFSKDLLNVERDWEKVGNYARRIKIIGHDYHYQDCYTNQFLN